jgi:folate-dependent phosphoribosylglycinamide formyltransferase PurN
MNILLVTSRVTYIPKNYFDLWEELLKKSSQRIKGLAIIDNLDSSIVKSTIGLFFLGAKKLAWQLTKNIFGSIYDPRKKLFKEHGIPLISIASMNSETIRNWIKNNDIDLVVNLRTRCIYKKEVLQTPRVGCINIHHGILPQYRGTFCDLYALSEGREAGFTIHWMNEKVDAGGILHISKVSRGDDKDYVEYLKKTPLTEAHALLELFDVLEKTNGQYPGTPNLIEKPTYTKNPTRPLVTEWLKKGMIL